MGSQAHKGEIYSFKLINGKLEIDLSKQGTEHMQKRTLLFSTKLKIFRISWIFFNFLFYCNFGYNQRFSPMKMGSVETNLTARKFTRCGFFSVRLRRSYFPLHDLSLISLTHWHIDSAIRKIKFHHPSLKNYQNFRVSYVMLHNTKFGETSGSKLLFINFLIRICAFIYSQRTFVPTKTPYTLMFLHFIGFLC